MTTSTHGLEEVLHFLESGARHFVLTSHARPDGDAIGSVLAMGLILDQIGATSELVLADPIPAVYRTLPGVERILHAAVVPPGDAPVIVLECDSTARTGLAGLDHRVLVNIDHHSSGRAFGVINWIDPDACALGTMIYDLALAARVQITPALATSLYVAMLSDTAAFTNSATNAATLALAATLARAGADPAELARQIFFSNPESKVRLLGTALSKMSRSGPIAWTSVTLAEMAAASADAEDCEGIVNYLIGIVGVESAAFLRELPGGTSFRLSLRSKGAVDVARTAEHFGGGGHRTASGCTLEGPLELAASRIVAQLEAGLAVDL